MKQNQFNPYVRDRRKRTRYYIDNELLKDMGQILKPHGIAVYNVLAKHANSETQSCFPSYETIMKQSGIGRRNTVTKYLKLLEKHNMIDTFRSTGKKPNIYYLLNSEDWIYNSIQKDTVIKTKNSPISIQEDFEEYPFGHKNNIFSDIDFASMDTLTHIKKSENIKSDKEQATFSRKKVGRAEPVLSPKKRTKEEQEGIEKSLKEMGDDLRKRGII